MKIPFRHQLPAYSPVEFHHLARSALLAGVAGEIEEVLRRDYHADDVLLCGSGTQALQVGLGEAVRRMDSRTVALPAFGCYDLASAVVGADVRVCLYDVDPSTLAPDLDSVRTAVKAGARTIVAAPLFGVPVPWEELEDVAGVEGCLLIEDAAQGHGATWRDRPLGAWGPLSVISFGRGKGWTSGGGGALFARGARLSAQLPRSPRASLVRAAMSSAVQWALGRPAVYGLPAAIPALGLGRTVYREPQPPHALSGYGRSLLAATRNAALAEVRQRLGNAARLADAALEAGISTFRPPASSTVGHIRFPIRLSGRARELARTTEARRLGIAPAYPAPLSQLAALAPYLLPLNQPFPGAEALARELVTLPTHSLLTDDDLRRLIRFMAERLGGSSPGTSADINCRQV